MINIKDKTTSSTVHISNTGDIEYLTRGRFEADLGDALEKLNKCEGIINNLVTPEQANKALQSIKDKLDEISNNK